MFLCTMRTWLMGKVFIVVLMCQRREIILKIFFPGTVKSFGHCLLKMLESEYAALSTF